MSNVIKFPMAPTPPELRDPPEPPCPGWPNPFDVPINHLTDAELVYVIRNAAKRLEAQGWRITRIRGAGHRSASPGAEPAR